MRHIAAFITILLTVSAVAGCKTTERSVRQSPADVTPPADAPRRGKMFGVDFPKWRRHYWVDKDVTGNAGYIVGAKMAPLPPPSDPYGSATYDAPAYTPPSYSSYTPVAPVVRQSTVFAPQPASAKPADQAYQVQPNDNLSKIAKKMYGSANRWRVIYDANRDRLKSPDMLRPGMTLRIPPEGANPNPSDSRATAVK